MPPQLLDADGKPITAEMIRRLREPVATATLSGVRQVITDPVAAGMTPDNLAGILLESERGNARRYLELAEAIEERDMHYAGVLSTRKRTVSQLPVTVEAASDDADHKKHAEFVEEWLETGVLDAALFDMLDGIGKGFSVHEIDWQTDTDGFQPRHLAYKPARWFDTPVTMGQIINDTVTVPDGQAIMLREAAGVTPLPSLKFVVHRHPAKSGLIMRSGLARLAAWGWMFKAFTAADWAVFVRNYGSPVRVGRYGPESSQADRDVLWQAVANIAGDCAAIIPKSMEIEFVELGDVSKGSELYERRCDWLDRQISKAVLGQTQTTDATTGGHAAGRTHRLVQEDIERADAKLLAATITAQLFQPMVALTFGPQDRYPKCRIGRPEEMPAAELATALQKLVPLGLKVGAVEVRRRLTLPDPGEDDELLGAPAKAAPGKAAGEFGGAPRPPGTEDEEAEEEGEERAAEEAAEDAREQAAEAPAMLSRLTQREGANHELLDAMTERMALDAQGALSGLTAQVKREFMAATSMEDLAERIGRMKLRRDDFAKAMRAGFALANLVGEANALDELKG